MAVKVAINGFGRIGRNVLRAIIGVGPHRHRRGRDQRPRAGRDQRPPAAPDSVHGKFPATVTTGTDTIDVGRGPIKVTALKNGRPALERRGHRAGMHRHLHLEGQGLPHWKTARSGC
jgi:glyceraldehyde-3-phosphate dehydrogenase/erythrose-4-phosphate dehydrogenase